MSAPSYRGYRFPADVVQRAVWMYLPFTLSYRDVADLFKRHLYPGFYRP